MKNKILEYTTIFFEKLLIELENLDISEEDNYFYHIKIKSLDGSILIGQNGQTIESLQRILGISIANIFDKEIRIKLEINDYHKSYEDKLFLRIDRSITSLLNNGGEYELGVLSPYDRKRIHSYIARNHNNIISKSRGEGKNRKMYLYIDNNRQKTKTQNINVANKKLTIDIDGDGI